MPKEEKAALFRRVDEILDDALAWAPEGTWFQCVKSLTVLESDRPDKNEVAVAVLEESIRNCSHLIEHPPIPLRTISNAYSCNYQFKEAGDAVRRMLPPQAEWPTMEMNSKNLWHLFKYAASLYMLGKPNKGKKWFELLAKSKGPGGWTDGIPLLAKRYLSSGGFLSYLEVMFFLGLFDKMIVEPEQAGPLLECLERQAALAEGALQPLTGEKAKKLVKVHKSFGSLLTFGYAGVTTERAAALLNRAT